MRVMVIVKANQASEAGGRPSAQLLTEMTICIEQVVKAGVMLACEGLRPSSRASARFPVTDHMDIDGTIAETSEQIASYWLWKVRDIDEAMAWLKRCRPLMPRNARSRSGPSFETDDSGEAMTPELQAQEARLVAKAKRNADR